MTKKKMLELFWALEKMFLYYNIVLKQVEAISADHDESVADLLIWFID